MDHEAIRHVSQVLQEQLSVALDTFQLPKTVYVGPLDDQQAANAGLVLFLHRVAINGELRNTEHRVAGPNGEITAHDGALPLDLYYLLTAGDRETGGEIEALRRLGCAIQAVNDRPVLVGGALQGETVRVSINPVASEEMGRIWTLFPTSNYRTSVVLIASPVWIDPASPRVAAPPVTNERYVYGQIAVAE